MLLPTRHDNDLFIMEANKCGLWPYLDLLEIMVAVSLDDAETRLSLLGLFSGLLALPEPDLPWLSSVPFLRLLGSLFA